MLHSMLLLHLLLDGVNFVLCSFDRRSATHLTVQQHRQQLQIAFFAILQLIRSVYWKINHKHVTCRAIKVLYVF